MRTFEEWGKELGAALDWGKEDEVVRLIRQAPAFVQDCARREWAVTPLQRMVHAELEQAVRCWIESGGKINSKARDGSTALHAAAEQGTVSLTSVLVEHGADPNAIANGMTPLAVAAERRDLIGGEIADLLLSRGASIDLTDAVWLDRPDEVRRILLECPSSVHRCRQPQRLLHNALAMDVDAPTILRILLEHGADPNVADEELGPPLLAAVKEGSLEAIRLLLADGADVSVRDAQGRILQEVARAANRDERVLTLLKNAGVP